MAEEAAYELDRAELLAAEEHECAQHVSGFIREKHERGEAATRHDDPVGDRPAGHGDIDAVGEDHRSRSLARIVKARRLLARKRRALEGPHHTCLVFSCKAKSLSPRAI